MPTITGYTMFRLLTAKADDGDGDSCVDYARWTGWEIWNDYVRLRLQVEADSAEYNKFKEALKSLYVLGYVKPLKPKTGRATAARSRWAPTQAGQDWWTGTGVDLHFSDDVEQPKKKGRFSDEHVGVTFHKTSNPIPSWAYKDLLQRYKRGELTLTFDVPNKTTGGSGR